MALLDSFDKIVINYFAVITEEVMVYKDVAYHPKPLHLNTLLFRGFTCPAMCGGCCPRFSLDYLPNAKHPEGVKARQVVLDGVSRTLFSDMQSNTTAPKCKHLNHENGRCGIHGYQPFSCDFELIRSLIFKQPDRPTILTQKLFGRGWNMMRVDGKRGALCKMVPITAESFDDTVRRLKRLEEWADYFELVHKCSAILKWAAEIRPYVLKNYHIDKINITI